MKAKIIVTHVWSEENNIFANLGLETNPSQEHIEEIFKNSVDWTLNMEEESSKIDILQKAIAWVYYKLVDSKDINNYRELYSLYDDDIEYNRCDLSLKWKESFIDFFEERFKNLDIKHEIETIISKEDKVYVKGKFFWKNIRLDKDISWDFMDVFTFTDYKTLKIKDRRTYLSNDTLKKYYSSF